MWRFCGSISVILPNEYSVQFSTDAAPPLIERRITMQNESRDDSSLLRDELLDKVVGGMNTVEVIELNSRDDVCAGCGIALGRKSYKYLGKSYCSKCFMQLKNKG